MVGEVDVTRTWEENYPHIYFSFLCSHFYDNQFQTVYLNTAQKHMGICQGTFLDLSFKKLEKCISNCVHFPSECIRQISHTKESNAVTFTE